jgi:LysM repeat protein
MKILRIPGIVLAVHLAAFLFVIAIPGCRSTSRQTSSTPPAGLPSDTPSVSYPGSTTTASPVAPASQGSSSVNDAALNPPLASGTDTVAFNPVSPSNTTVHFNPTRPGTPVAGALQTAPVSDVTPASTYTAVAGDSLWKIAKKHGVTANELVTANNLKPGSPIRAGQKLIIPGKGPGPASGPAAPAPAGETLTYKVKAGETLAGIAKRAGTSVASIRSLNKLKNDSVHAGQELILPAGGNAAAAIAASPEGTPAEAAPKASSQNGTKYVVRNGETMSQIAKRFGVPLRDIAAANNIADPLKLKAGRELLIPAPKTPAGKNAAPAPAPAPAAPAPETPSPVSPVASPVAPANEGPVSAPAEPAPPVNPVDESSPVSSPKSTI